MIITQELKDRFLIDYRYELSPDFARQVVLMTDEIMAAGRNKGKTWDQQFRDCSAIVLEHAAVEAFGCELLKFKVDAADVVDPETGYRIDCKTQRGEWWDLKPEHLKFLRDSLKEVDLILTGSFVWNTQEGYADISYKQLIDPKSIFDKDGYWNDDYAPLSHFKDKKAKEWHYYNYKRAVENGRCARR